MFYASISASASEFHLEDEKKNCSQKISPNKQQNKRMALVTCYNIYTLCTLHYTSKSNVLFVKCATIFHAFLCRI